MQTQHGSGAVFKLAEGFFGVLYYRPDTHVVTVELPAAHSVTDAVRALSRFGYKVEAADSGRESWGKVVLRDQQGKLGWSAIIA